MHVGEKTKNAAFWWETPKKGANLQDLDVDGRTIIKSTL